MSLLSRIKTDLQNIPSVLTSIGGHREHRPKLQTKLTTSTQPMSEMQEMMESSTITQEIGAEITQRLISIARNAVMENFAFGDDNPVLAGLNTFGEKCTVIAPPAIVARLQKEATFLSLRGGADSFVSLPFIGLLGTHEVFLDPYHTGAEAIVCLPGWFSFNSGSVIYDGGYYRDPIEQQIIYEFYDDVDFSIDPRLIQGLIYRS